MEPIQILDSLQVGQKLYYLHNIEEQNFNNLVTEDSYHVGKFYVGSTGTVGQSSSSTYTTVQIKAKPFYVYQITLKDTSNADRYRIAFANTELTGASSKTKAIKFDDDLKTAPIYAANDDYKFLYIYLSTSGKMPEIEVYEFSNARTEIRRLNKKYVPFHPFHWTGTPLLMNEAIDGVTSSNNLSKLYTLFNGLFSSVGKYKNFVKKETINKNNYLNFIQGNATSMPADAKENDIYLYPTETPGVYTQKIKKGNSEERMFTKVVTDTGLEEHDLVTISRDINVYTISPYENCEGTILLMNGIHGAEVGSNAATYYITKILLEHIGTGDDIDIMLSRYNVKIIPAVNPDSVYNNNASEHGYSDNLINMNRDFPVNWVDHSSDSNIEAQKYDRTGNYPLYDPYSRVIAGYLKTLKDVKYYLIKHDDGTVAANGRIGWTTDEFKASSEMTKEICKQISHNTKTNEPWFINDYIKNDTTDRHNLNQEPLFILNTSSTSTGTITTFLAQEFDFKGGILEVPYFLNRDGSQTTPYDIPVDEQHKRLVKINVDVTINLLLGAYFNLETINSSSIMNKAYPTQPYTLKEVE